MSDVLRMAWRQGVATPLARMLALSVCLHLAVIMVVQPAPGGSRPRTVVIQAHLSRAEPVPEPVPVQTAEAAIPPPPGPSPAPPPPEPRAALEPPKPASLESPSPSPPAPPVARPVAEAPAQAPASPSSQKPGEPATPAPVPAPVPVAMPSPNADAASRTSEGREDGLPRVPVPFDTRWYAARELDVLPKAQAGIHYQYPEAARERGLEGSVLVLLKVDELGRVRDLEILESTPPGVFDATVKAVLERVVFTPARRDGAPVRALVKHRVRFELN